MIIVVSALPGGVTRVDHEKLSKSIYRSYNTALLYLYTLGDFAPKKYRECNASGSCLLESYN